MKILLELRPALDGHAGIPQETRLLFRTLARMPGVEVQGLIQSSNKILPHAGPPDGEMPQDRQIDRQSRVIVALQQNEKLGRFTWVAEQLKRLFVPMAMVLGSAIGLRTALSRFDPEHFKDFIWRSLFAKSLPLEDHDIVTSQAFRVVRAPWAAMHLSGLLTRPFGRALYPRLDTKGIDVAIVETPYPGRMRAPTKLVVRYHDAIPLLMPHTIIDRRYHQASHYHALRRNVDDGAWFACVSEATRRDLISVFPSAAERAITIPNMVSHHYFAEDSSADRVPEIVWARKNRNAPESGGVAIPDADVDGKPLAYLLVVSTIEPRKNHLAVLDAWEQLRTSDFPTLNLVFVGSLGWEHQAIVRRLGPWLERGGLHLLENVPSAELRLLYRHARATVCPSFSEGFDFAGIEAMCSGGVVAASDIPVHREIYGNAARYFSPYSSDELRDALRGLIGSSDASLACRQELIDTGTGVAAAYESDRLVPQWTRFLDRVIAATP